MAAPLFLNGAGNIQDPILHQPLYYYFWLLIVVFTVMMWVVFRYGIWTKYEPVHGLYRSHKGKSQASFIFNKGLVGELVGEEEEKCIFDYYSFEFEGASWFERKFLYPVKYYLPEVSTAQAIIYKLGGVRMSVPIARKLQNYDWEKQSSVTLAGVHTDMCADLDDFSVKDSHQHAAVVEAALRWNDDPSHEDDQIHSYNKFQRYLLEGKIACPAGIQPTVLIEWEKIDRCFPLGARASAFGGGLRQRAQELANEANSMNKYILPLLGCSFIFALVLLVVRVFG
jgi:hypothetical protein